jgi:hypothetical protein
MTEQQLQALAKQTASASVFLIVVVSPWSAHWMVTATMAPTRPPSGRALAGMLAVLRNSNGIFCGTGSRRESIKPERTGNRMGDQWTAGKLVPEMKQLRRDGTR